MKVETSKSQAPSSRETPSSENTQVPCGGNWLGFVVSLELGGWCLELAPKEPA